MKINMFRVEYTLDGNIWKANVLAKDSMEAQQLIAKFVKRPLTINTVSAVGDGLHAISEEIRNYLATPIVKALRESYDAEITRLNEEIQAYSLVGDSNEENAVEYLCDFCAESLKSPAGLYAHIRNKHKDEYTAWKEKREEAK